MKGGGDRISENNFEASRDLLYQALIEIIKMLGMFDFYKFASVNLDKDSINALLNSVETLILNFKR
ncbi:MAG: hypothetical protein LBN19_01030 [Endomicrobium sp.]|jgi:hypothetical protein|nr:hypothetical protein [Endomicrobium sp.]